MSHTLRPSIIQTLQNRRNGSSRKLAQELGFPPSFAATLSDVLNGKHSNVSLLAENQIRAALNLEPVRLTRKRIRRELTPARRQCGMGWRKGNEIICWVGE